MACIRLMRPANIVTSVADVLAGITISGFFSRYETNANQELPVILLCISTIGLYGGGVVFNDVFDAALDAVERPERPIPSGLVTQKQASVLGILLLFVGIASALLAGPAPALISISISAAALIYDKWGKHHSILVR